MDNHSFIVLWMSPLIHYYEEYNKEAFLAYVLCGVRYLRYCYVISSYSLPSSFIFPIFSLIQYLELFYLLIYYPTIPLLNLANNPMR